MGNLIGRERECERLKKCMQAMTAQLVVIYGRRRVGKTFLVNQYFNNKFAQGISYNNKNTSSFVLRVKLSNISPSA